MVKWKKQSVGNLSPLYRTNAYRGVIFRGEYGYFLRFQITQRFNNLIIHSGESTKLSGLVLK